MQHSENRAGESERKDNEKQGGAERSKIRWTKTRKQGKNVENKQKSESKEKVVNKVNKETMWKQKEKRHEKPSK